MLRFGMILLLFGCASSKPAEPPPAAPPAATAPAAAPTPAAAAADDPERRLTRVECNQAVDHVAGLPDDSPQAKQVIATIKENRDQFVDQCVETAKKKDLDCLLSKKSFPELGTCPQPGQ
jgi:hypothetical protein